MKENSQVNEDDVQLVDSNYDDFVDDSENI